MLDKIKGKVIAIVANHGHLDHNRRHSKARRQVRLPDISTPFTIELIDNFMQDDKKNRRKTRCL